MHNRSWRCRPALLLPALCSICLLGSARLTMGADQCAQKLTPADAGPGQRFGRHAAIHGDRIAVGAPDDSEAANLAGAVYIFRRDAGGWVQEAKLIAEDAQAGASFGYTVDLSADHVAAGAVNDRNGGSPTGATYVFRRDDQGTPEIPQDDTWVQQAKLVASDAAAADLFGIFVWVEGDYIVIGSDSDDTPIFNAGSAYVYVRDDASTPADPNDDTWVEQAKLVAGDATPNDLFGRSVAMSGDFIAVGVYVDDEVGSNAGSTYLYRRDDNDTPGVPTDDSWTEHAKIVGSNTAASDQFGIGVAMEDDWLLVGAFHQDIVASDAGAAYVFRRDDNATPLEPADDLWTEHQILVADDGAAGDEFGRFVSISGDGILVGAYRDDDNGMDSGAAYFFRRNDNGTPADLSDDVWAQAVRLSAPDGTAGDWYGYSVGLDDGIALIAARRDDAFGFDSGSAYVHDVLGGIDCNGNGINDGCETDCNTNGVLDACDLAADTSEDCNANEQPDECETAGVGVVAPGVDCNANDIIDTCEIDDGMAEDCNSNAVPDDCETLADGIDLDGDVDLLDFARFQACFIGVEAGSPEPACCILDFDSDGDLDLDDYALLANALNGP